MSFSLSESEKDLLILGVLVIVRENTTILCNESLKNSIIYERILNNGLLDLRSLFNNNSSILQTQYMSLYQALTNSNVGNQSITTTTIYKF